MIRNGLPQRGQLSLAGGPQSREIAPARHVLAWEDEAMSQRSVELVIGRLATDEEFRRRFEASREAALEALIASGLPLTPVERRALLDLDLAACQRFARRLDPRLQKIDVRNTPS